jgi:DNA repair protein RadA/Sms
MVDTVLYFEGDNNNIYRVLRAVKNRFGSTNEIGIFEMTQLGLMEVPNPSETLLQGRPIHEPGSVIVASIEGTRPMLIEIQALVTPAVYGNPRRLANGLDYNRVSLLMAVMEKKTGFQAYSYDAYVNITGGIQIKEPALDLGLVLAIMSSLKEKPVSEQLTVVGEVGLSGEIRAVSQIEPRIIEAEKMGFKKIIIPRGNLKQKGNYKIEIIEVDSLNAALASAFEEE